MPERNHRLGVSEIHLVVRRLRLQPCERAAMRSAVEEIDQIYGLDSVSWDEDSHLLRAAYDASRTGIDCIEEVLAKYGVEICRDWWTRFKEGYYRLVDQNVKDNSRREPWSCHQTPATRR